MTQEERATLDEYLRNVDEDEQHAYERGWRDCMDEYKYQEFIEQQVLDRVELALKEFWVNINGETEFPFRNPEVLKTFQAYIYEEKCNTGS